MIMKVLVLNPYFWGYNSSLCRIECFIHFEFQLSNHSSPLSLLLVLVSKGVWGLFDIEIFSCRFVSMRLRNILSGNVTIPCLYPNFISSLLAIHFLFSSNPLFGISITKHFSLLLSLSITQLFIIQPFYYSALYYSAFSLFSSITQWHFY